MTASPPAGLRELPPAGYLGIDFGTSNTHIAVCYLDGNMVPQPVPLAGKNSIPTCVLFKEPDANVIAFGAKAVQAWLMLNDSERAEHRLAAGFKPDIAEGERSALARQDAVAFLRKCYQAVREGNMVRAVGSQEGMPVVIGVPAEIKPHQKEITQRLAREAGFGEAVTLDEPLGALAFHLADGSLTPQEIRKGIVVVDFGGGTFDVALLDARHGLAAPWGAPTLGGRLFDDLFYQWLLEQNLDLKLSDRDQWYVWQVVSRELKETFSNHWKSEGPEAKFEDFLKLPGKRFANFECRNADAFLERARKYRPSPPAAKYFSQLGAMADLGKSGGVDLIEWIRNEMRRGYQQRPDGLSRVVLTGGSSNWPFMFDMASECFHVPRERILLSPQPEITIGSGLAVYRVLEHRNAVKRVKLSEELPKYKAKFEKSIARQIEQFTNQAAEAIVAPVIAQVEQTYQDWYRNGGTLNAVNAKIDAFTKNLDIPKLLRGQDEALAADLVRLIRDHLAVWLAEHGIDRDVDEYAPAGGVKLVIPSLSGQSQEIAAVISQLIAVSIASTVFTAVLIGAHAAHIAVSPVTGTVVAAGAAIASYVGYKALDDKVRAAVMSHEWGTVSKWALTKFLSEKYVMEKIAESRKDMTAKITQLLRTGHAADANAAGWQSLDQLQTAVAGQFEGIVKQVIHDLGVLEEVRKAGQ